MKNKVNILKVFMAEHRNSKDKYLSGMLLSTMALVAKDQKFSCLELLSVVSAS
jgi:hypothetical protein